MEHFTHTQIGLLDLMGGEKLYPSFPVDPSYGYVIFLRFMDCDSRFDCEGPCSTTKLRLLIQGSEQSTNSWQSCSTKKNGEPRWKIGE